MTHRTVAEIEAELAEARAAERRELEIRQAAVQPRYLFTLMPSQDKYDRVFDPTCKLYTLEGFVLNKSELAAVSKTAHQGSMKYVWNGATEHFVMAVGGGSIFVSTNEAWNELSEFIVSRPQGGDVTEIVTRHMTV